MEKVTDQLLMISITIASERKKPARSFWASTTVNMTIKSRQKLEIYSKTTAEMIIANYSAKATMT